MSESDDGQLTADELLEKIRKYEAKFGMTTEEFLDKWKRHEIPDKFASNLWASWAECLPKPPSK